MQNTKRPNFESTVKDVLPYVKQFDQKYVLHK